MYTYSDYVDTYGEYGFDMDDADLIRMIIFDVKYENESSEDKTFEPDNMTMYAKNSHLQNGAMLLTGENKVTLKPGESCTCRLVSVAYARSLVKEKWIDKMAEDTYYLVFWWYPVTKQLEFEVVNG